MISSEYGWTDGQILDLTLARLRQIRDVIQKKHQELLKERLTYKEIEVRALLGAIHSAAGNKKGAAASQKFSFHKQAPAVAKESQLRGMVGAAPGDTGEEFRQELLAEVARLKGAAA